MHSSCYFLFLDFESFIAIYPIYITILHHIYTMGLLLGLSTLIFLYVDADVYLILYSVIFVL